MERKITKKYTNGEVTVVWQPHICIHSTICFKGLPQVFNPNKRPWITTEQSTTKEIIDQVSKCPSGALSFYMNEETPEKDVKVDAETIIEPVENGPLLVYGNITIKKQNGETHTSNKVTAFCRCGASGNKPFCDGTHKKIDFRAS